MTEEEKLEKLAEEYARNNVPSQAEESEIKTCKIDFKAGYQSGKSEGRKEILPTLDEAGVIALKIAESVEPELTAKDQALFIAGFQECIKYLTQENLSK